jgi:hypothetical protein
MCNNNIKAGTAILTAAKVLMDENVPVGTIIDGLRYIAQILELNAAISGFLTKKEVRFEIEHVDSDGLDIVVTLYNVKDAGILNEVAKFNNLPGYCFKYTVSPIIINE